ncbi:replication initiation protein RepM [Moraxella osloensis]|uniref:replication initiation protein RepM n=1 Tax=Moraxella sp. CTOTU49803 TaxID=2953840 RepID=UPI0024C42534|nr:MULTISPECIES: replication initiation protein RepM [Moraxella]MDK1671214.1 replication initiation protein RepM [Moraxella osloensis]
MGNLVVKDNALIEASHKLSEVEQRLILLAILKAREVGDKVEELKDKELVIHASDYMNAFGVDRDAGYKSLKKAVMGLYQAEWGYHYINSKGNVVVRYERFTQSAVYIENEATVKFMFANAIIPMLVELERNFTSYEIEQVAHLRSRYAMRLYECLIRFKASKTLTITLDELRFRFGLLPDEYILMSNFKNRVLDLAVREINANTDITVSYDQHKQGRTITGFTFKFKTTKAKTAKADKADRDPNTLDLFVTMTDKQRFAFANKISRLPEASHLAKGQANTSYDAFAEQIAKDLLNNDKQKVYLPFLQKVGFKNLLDPV